MPISRRNFFKVAGLGMGVSVAGFSLPLGQSVSTADWISTAPKPKRFTRPLRVPQPVSPTPMSDEYGDYLFYEIHERAVQAQILDPGAPQTTVLGYAFGDAAPTVPGPLLKIDQNTRVKMRVYNDLPATHPTFGHELATSVHLHGSASLPQYDGYANDVTPTGHYKDYWYPNHQGPRTLWYHDHQVMYTSKNAYSGLLAQYHISNAWERQNLPQGKYDVPLVVSDAMFNSDGSLAFLDRDHSGLWGDVIMVNGVPWPYMNVERRFYRFRVLLATLARSMNLRFVNTRTGAILPTYIVGTDGGLMNPQKVNNWRHAGAERYEVMVDFKGCLIGDKVELRNVSNVNNRDFLYTGSVMQFRVTANPTDLRWNSVVPLPASETHKIMTAPATLSRRTRTLELDHDDITNEFMLNGKTWHDIEAEDFNLFTSENGDPPKPGDYEIWRIVNNSSGWYHPLHIHLVDFRILSRKGGSGIVQPWEKGPKDVVYLGEGETIDVLVQYAMVPQAYPDGRSTGQAGVNGDKGGRYMIHCHNLTHEDHDMMGQFVVAASDGTLDLSTSHPNYPITDNTVDHTAHVG